MEQSRLPLVKRKREFLCQSEINNLPTGMRGVYVLYRRRTGIDKRTGKRTSFFNVVYVGMATGGGAVGFVTGSNATGTIRRSSGRIARSTRCGRTFGMKK